MEDNKYAIKGLTKEQNNGILQVHKDLAEFYNISIDESHEVLMGDGCQHKKQVDN